MFIATRSIKKQYLVNREYIKEIIILFFFNLKNTAVLKGLLRKKNKKTWW